jgi:hypothetical protein
MERCAIGILVVEDVFKHCLVVGCWLCLGGGAFGGVFDCKSFALV